MADKHELEIEIAPDGEINVHIKGVKGKSCLKYVDLFKKLFGETKQIKHTSEYYEPDTHINIETQKKY